MKPRNIVAKIVTVVLFSLLILSFAVWGIGDIFRSTGQMQSVAEIGDTTIDQAAFARELSVEMNTMSRRLGVQLTMDQARAFGIPQQVLERMITRALLDELSSRMGLLVTEEQMRKQILENPAFQGANGRFDVNRFNMVLQNARMSEPTFLAQLGDDIKRQQLVDAVTGAAAAPESLAQRLFTYREERRVADYVTVANNSFTDLGEPDEAALQATYDDAGSALMTPAFKQITLVVLSVAEAAQNIAISDERIAEAFENRKAALSRPERRHVVQAVLPDEAATRALVEKITAPGDFAAAVEEATGRPPVDLGTVTQDDLPEELGAAIFALDEGTPSAPIQTSFGWHVALVRAIEPGSEATLEGSREQLRQQLAQSAAVDIVIDLANQFDEMLAGGASIEEAAQRLNQDAREIPAIDNRARGPGGDVIEGLPSLNGFLPVLNRTAVGETSTLTETLDGDYFILRVDGETPAEKKPLAEVRDQVVEMWRAGEQSRLAAEKAEALAERLRGGADLAEVAAAEGLNVAETAPVTRFENDPQRTPSPQLSQQLFEIAEGEVTTVATGNGQIVARLKQVMEPASENREARLASLQDELTASLQNDVFEQFLNALQSEFAVTINQRLVNETLTSF
ncbi:SurA N-terminal domain-containing protein [Pelagibius sp. 7325]|uniref:SurA N-terminal domain-containing protein n=1 Tax=Pelagibius sp. 7325 TaxID=3131994 RepID=UPI0030ED5EF3